MSIPKPAAFIDWTDGDAAKVIEPTVSKKLLGFVADERPFFKEVNFLFFRIDEWLKFFESATDDLVAKALNFDQIVGAAAGATDADLTTALSNAVPGNKILVLDNETINTRVLINVNDIEIIFKPGVVFSKGADTIALDVTAARVKIRGGRFTGFTVGGDIAIRFQLNADFGHVLESIFGALTVTEVDDSGVGAGRKPVVGNTITEV